MSRGGRSRGEGQESLIVRVNLTFDENEFLRLEPFVY